MDRVLLLNESYEPLNLCSWRRAIILMIKGKAERIDSYNNFIDATSQTYAPSVIRLTNYVAVPKKELPFSKKNILIRDNYTCQYCGKVCEDLTLDHVFPKSRGGATSWENIVAACSHCNQYKADRTPEEAGMKLLNHPIKPIDITNFVFLNNVQREKFGWDKYIA